MYIDGGAAHEGGAGKAQFAEPQADATADLPVDVETKLKSACDSIVAAMAGRGL